MAKTERFRRDEHYYQVIRYGNRMTIRSFRNYKDALEYYDLQCIRHKASGYSDITLAEVNRPGSKYATDWLFTTSKTISNVPHRNVYADKKKQPSPFGLLG